MGWHQTYVHWTMSCMPTPLCYRSHIVHDDDDGGGGVGVGGDVYEG